MSAMIAAGVWSIAISLIAVVYELEQIANALREKQRKAGS